jgi:rRNA maturation protein Nop10
MPTTSRENAQGCSYRTAAERVEDPETLPEGPAEKCPACGMQRLFASTQGANVADAKEPLVALVGYHSESPLNYPVACSRAARVSVGFLRKCKEPGNHLHEHCKECGFRWLTAFAGTP